MGGLFVAWAFIAAGPSLAGSDGWTAVQSHSGSDDVSNTSSFTYAQHHLRIEDEKRAVILDLQTGTMTYVDPPSRAWARITLAELVELRDAALAQLETKIETLPPNLQKQFRAELERQKRDDRTAPKLRPTDREDTVHDVRCRVHVWSGSDGEGEVCLASKLPVDTRAFEDDAKALGQLLERSGASQTVSSLAFLRLSQGGFPVRTVQRVETSPGSSIRVESTFKDFRPLAAPALMKPPAAYERLEFSELMNRVLRRGAQP